MLPPPPARPATHPMPVGPFPRPAQGLPVREGPCRVPVPVESLRSWILQSRVTSSAPMQPASLRPGVSKGLGYTPQQPVPSSGSCREHTERLDAGPCNRPTSGVSPKPPWPGLVVEEATVVSSHARFLITAGTSSRSGPFCSSDLSYCGVRVRTGRHRGQGQGSPCCILNRLKQWEPSPVLIPGGTAPALLAGQAPTQMDTLSRTLS
ncbi:hypothetical protein HJG60_011135 [Phyllostomus discolor]|uniref:Uncharacterized protein n=1 Tax=Phyllostomus discolor TaxID=89673 RepID=A0A834A6Y9_9CHIR|nr:hypothetical protein HJG60_011135 [Phyllostomus discolor]